MTNRDLLFQALKLFPVPMTGQISARQDIYTAKDIWNAPLSALVYKLTLAVNNTVLCNWSLRALFHLKKLCYTWGFVLLRHSCQRLIFRAGWKNYHVSLTARSSTVKTWHISHNVITFIINIQTSYNTSFKSWSTVTLTVLCNKQGSNEKVLSCWFRHKIIQINFKVNVPCS